MTWAKKICLYNDITNEPGLIVENYGNKTMEKISRFYVLKVSRKLPIFALLFFSLVAIFFIANFVGIFGFIIDNSVIGKGYAAAGLVTILYFWKWFILWPLEVSFLGWVLKVDDEKITIVSTSNGIVSFDIGCIDIVQFVHSNNASLISGAQNYSQFLEFKLVNGASYKVNILDPIENPSIIFDQIEQLRFKNKNDLTRI